MRYLTRLLFIIIILSIHSCTKINEPPPPVNYINPNIILVKEHYDAEYWMGVWSGNSIYTLSAFRRLTIDNEFKVIGDSLYHLTYDPPVLAISTYMAINISGTKMLIVESRYLNISCGKLYEIDLNTKSGHCIKDSTHNISSAVYYENDSTCIYYSYGNIDNGKVAGYYRLNITTGYDSLLFPYFPEVGYDETVNGFDVNSKSGKLLIPLNYYQKPPRILEYDLLNHGVDTLRVSFDRRFLWLRSNNDGSKILYSNYPEGYLNRYVDENAEVGIIDSFDLSKRILDVNTEPGGLSTSILPSWSSDCKHIVFGNAQGPAEHPARTLGLYSLYILKNVY